MISPKAARTLPLWRKLMWLKIAYVVAAILVLFRLARPYTLSYIDLYIYVALVPLVFFIAAQSFRSAVDYVLRRQRELDA